jgi:hypothetical protein
MPFIGYVTEKGEYTLILYFVLALVSLNAQSEATLAHTMSEDTSSVLRL